MVSRSLVLELLARTGRYRSELRRAVDETHRLDRSIDRVVKSGARLGAVGLGAIAAGAAVVGTQAVQAFLPFEASLARIEGLVGVDAAVVADFADQIKDLAVATGRGPQELADALFFITSAGLEGADALDALDASARAATAGLGDTALIADAVTSAVNAYGSEMLSASEATDILVATVREGKAEAAALTGSLGRVIPIAANLGVEFNEVGAAVAALTRGGLSADEAVTALRQVLVSLLDPSSQARTQIAELGLSVGGLQQQLADQGLLATLSTLETSFDGNSDAMATVFGNVRALTGVLGLLGGNADQTRQIFGELEGAAGSLDSAFEVAAGTGAFTFAQAWAEIQVQLIEIGEEILPALLDAFREIQPAIGPALLAVGDLTVAATKFATEAAPAVVGALEFMAAGAENFAIGQLRAQRGLESFVEGLTFGLAGDSIFTEADGELQALLETVRATLGAFASGADRVDTLAAAMAALERAGKATPKNLADLAAAVGATDAEMGRASATIRDHADALGLDADQVQFLEDITARFRSSLEDTNRETAIAAMQARLAAEAEAYFAAQAAAADAALESAEPTVRTYQRTIADMVDDIQAASDEHLRLSDIMRSAADPVFKAAKSMENYNKVLDDIGPAGERTAEEQLRLAEALLTLQSDLDAMDADTLRLAMEAIGQALGISTTGVQDLLEQLGILDGYTAAVFIELHTTGIAGEDISIGDVVPSGTFTKLAGGGQYSAGEPILVGESGPELQIPDRAGQIIPNNQLRGFGGNVTTSNTIQINHPTSGNLREDLRLAGMLGGIGQDLQGSPLLAV